MILARLGVPNLWAMDWYWVGTVRNWAAQQEVDLNVLHLNHPETIPVTPPMLLAPSVEKLSSTALTPGAKKVGDH